MAKISKCSKCKEPFPVGYVFAYYKTKKICQRCFEKTKIRKCRGARLSSLYKNWLKHQSFTTEFQ